MPLSPGDERRGKKQESSQEQAKKLSLHQNMQARVKKEKEGKAQQKKIIIQSVISCLIMPACQVVYIFSFQALVRSVSCGIAFSCLLACLPNQCEKEKRSRDELALILSDNWRLVSAFFIPCSFSNGKVRTDAHTCMHPPA